MAERQQQKHAPSSPTSKRSSKKTEEEKQSKNKELDRARKKTRINIRASFQRWRSCGICQDFSAGQVRTCWIYVSLSGCVSTQGLHPLECTFDVQLCHNGAQRLSQFKGYAACFSLFLEDAPLLSFVAINCPRFIAPEEKKERNT